MNRVAFFIVVAFVTGAPTLAQQSYPMLMGIEPVAAQAGTTSEHVVKSRYTMADAYEVLVSGDGVSGHIVLPESKDDQNKQSTLQSLTVHFTVDDDATTGVRDFRIVTPNGVSTTGQLVIVRDKVTIESGDNNSIDGANAVELPATICGRIEKAEDVDYFKFHADAGQTFCFHVRCMRLQDRIHDLQQHADPMLSLRSAAGSTIAAVDNLFAADPFLTYTFEKSGEYYLELRDVRYQGNQYWGYCIEANSRPFVQTVFPLAVTNKVGQTLELIGENLSGHVRGKVVSTLSAEPGIHDVLVSVAEQVVQPVTVILTEQGLSTESDEDNDSIAAAQSQHLPIHLNGRVQRDGDIDCYAFDAKKGERYTFEIIARRAGSSLDPHLRILNETGSQLQLSDDVQIGKRNFADSRIENWSVPADGKYIIEVRDVHLRGGLDFSYLLSASSSEPYFALYTDTDKTPLTPGTSGVVYVRAEKKNGFDGEVQLHVDELPEGVTATCGRILGGKRQDGCIVLSAANESQPIAKPIRIYGTANVGSTESPKQYSTDATVYQEIYQPGGGRGHWPVDAHVVSVGTPGDVRKVRLSTYDLTLKPGESRTIDVEIERAEGFDKNVTLEVIYKHLSSVYGDPFPEGITVDASASKLLLTGGATTGKITLKASDKVSVTDKQVFTVMANVSLNFVIKATYASDPVTLTIQAK
ncbi:MAG: PPC domain-containing protein [Planctomycetales bacterium]|nr:PPC domain-containing protein [Planctomycetales bacterium]